MTLAVAVKNTSHSPFWHFLGAFCARNLIQLCIRVLLFQYCLSDPFLMPTHHGLSQVAKHLVYNIECYVFNDGSRLVAAERLVT